MSASLSPTFLAGLAQVYATLRPQAPSGAFLADLKRVYDTLPAPSDENLQFLANRFDKWRNVTRELVRTRLLELDRDDPLLCPISLFRPRGYGRLETAHTRTLAWLLDPNGEHGFGTTLLAALLHRLSGNDFSKVVQDARVKSEELIDGAGAGGRLDVLAEGTWQKGKGHGWVLVIEAKVDAGEGDDQLQRYEQWLRANAAGREVFRVFLTPDALTPETAAEDWESLTFCELVQIFRTVYGGLRAAPGFHFLRFYLAGVLQDICHFPRYIAEEAADPFAVATYLKGVLHFPAEGSGHDGTR